MTVTAESALDPDFRQAASLLEGAVAPVGSGSKAIDVLEQASGRRSARTGSGIDEWLQILADAGLEVFPDADGPVGGLWSEQALGSGRGHGVHELRLVPAPVGVRGA